MAPPPEVPFNTVGDNYTHLRFLHPRRYHQPLSGRSEKQW